ncbi:MAG: APC family permease [bacterium]|jgi:amino acid transporter|nr:APC family permease [bacterium]
MGDISERPVTAGNAASLTEGVAGASTLKRNSLSMPEVLAQSVANAAPSAAMALLPLLVFLAAGNGTWLSFVVTLLIMLCVAYCAVQFARYMTSAGSFYVWVSRVLGPAAGHTAGWGLIFGYVCIGILTFLGFGIFGGDFLDRLGLPGSSIPVQLVLYAASFVIATAMALWGVQLATRAALLLEGISIAAILIVCVAIWVRHGNVIDLQQLTLAHSGTGGIVVGVVLGILAFTGFESAGSLGMEARNPYKTVGRAIMWSAIIVGVFYIVVSYSQVYGFQGTQPGFAKSQAPLPDLAKIVGLSFFSYIIDLGICCSMLACTLACINASARIAFAAAHDGLLVPAFARSHPRRKTPYAGILAAALLMVLPSTAMLVAYRDPVSVVNWVAPLAAFGCMVGYALISIAAPVFMQRLGRFWIPSAVLGGIGLIAVVIVFYANWLPQTIPGGLFPALTLPYTILPYVLFGWIALGLLDYYRLWHKDREAARLVGTRFESSDDPVNATPLISTSPAVD